MKAYIKLYRRYKNLKNKNKRYRRTIRKLKKRLGDKDIEKVESEE